MKFLVADPQLLDIFRATKEKLKDVHVEEDLAQIEETFKSFVKALKKRVADSFREIRTDMFMDPRTNPKEEPLKGGGNSTELHDRPRPVHVDHLGKMDSLFQKWVPRVNKDIQMSALILSTFAKELGNNALKLAQKSSEELRRIPVLYGRLRRKLQTAFAKADHKNHRDLHQKHVIQSECGKKYTIEEFIELFDHDRNLLLTEESFWTPKFEEEFFEGWPVWANEMRIQDYCGSRKWFIPEPTEEEKSKKAKEEL